MNWQKATQVSLCILGLVVFLVACVGVFLLVKEKSWQWDVEARLERTRADFGTGFGTSPMQRRTPGMRYKSSEAEQRKLASISGELGVATPFTLQSPSICEAIYYSQFDSKQAMLVVYWLEDQPTLDGVRVIWDDGRTRDFPIPREYFVEYREVAKHAILYDVSFAFPYASSDEAEFLANPVMSVVLVRAGKEVSVGWPVAWVDRATGDEIDNADPAVNDAK